MNRVIFLEYAHLGDALLLTPAIRLAKEKRKDLEIILIIPYQPKIKKEQKNLCQNRKRVISLISLWI